VIFLSKKESKYSRKGRKSRIENNTILIVCGGKTEEKYFKQWNIDLGKIKVKPVTQPKNPMNIVEHAIKMRSLENYRQVWCVFDKDEFEDFDEAIFYAYKNGINTAFSNKAFEYWFLIHYEKTYRSMNIKDLIEKLSSYIGEKYKKGGQDMYNLLKDKIDIAIQNAKWGHQLHKKEGGKPSVWESCTTVYELVEELKKWKIAE